MSSTNSKDKNNPQKRIEYRGENIRVSRTGGVSATKTFKGDGVGATINTKHGLRLHKRLFKGQEWVSKMVTFSLLEDIKVVHSISIFPKMELVLPSKTKEVPIIS